MPLVGCVVRGPGLHCLPDSCVLEGMFSSPGYRVPPLRCLVSEMLTIISLVVESVLPTVYV